MGASPPRCPGEMGAFGRAMMPASSSATVCGRSMIRESASLAALSAGATAGIDAEPDPDADPEAETDDVDVDPVALASVDAGRVSGGSAANEACVEPRKTAITRKG